LAILSYHKVDDRFEWGATRVTPRQFKKQVDFIVRCGYGIVSASAYFNIGGEKLVGLTFDDAYESVYENAIPILDAIGANYTIFPITDYVGKINQWEVNLGWRRFRHMSWEQLISLKGAEIGSHTVSHRCLTGLSRREIQIEVADSKKIIEDRTGSLVKFLSLPFGRYNETVVEIAREAGYQKIFSMNPFEGEDGFVCGRCGVYLFDSLKSLRNKVAEGRGGKMEKRKLKFYNMLSRGTIIVKGWRGEN